MYWKGGCLKGVSQEVEHELVAEYRKKHGYELTIEKHVTVLCSLCAESASTTFSPRVLSSVPGIRDLDPECADCAPHLAKRAKVG